MNDHATMSPAGAPVPPAGGNRPEPADDFEVLLITGMSGAGRSHAADCVEDMGWYVVDNLPPKLLVPLVDMMTNAGKDGVHKLAAVIDVRSREYFDDLSAVLSHLDDLGVRTRILFLDASDEVLIKRYESVRRPHPLQRGNRLIDGILEERSLLDNLKERADMVIDTSLAEHPPAVDQTIRGDARLRPVHGGRAHLQLRIQNTGCRWTPISWRTCGSCRTHSGCRRCESSTGKTSPVSDYVLSSPGAGDFLDAYERAILVALEGYAHEDKHFVTIAIGCTGGQHRSVVMSEELARRLRAHGISVTVSARELQRRAHSETVQPLCKHFVSIIRQHRVFLSK